MAQALAPFADWVLAETWLRTRAATRDCCVLVTRDMQRVERVDRFVWNASKRVMVPLGMPISVRPQAARYGGQWGLRRAG